MYYVLKYSLIILLLLVLIIIGYNLLLFSINLIKNLIIKIKMFSLKDLKLNLEYYKHSQDPKGPKKWFHFLFDKDEKKRRDELKKRALDLKEKVLNINREHCNNNLNIDYNQSSFSNKRNWKETLDFNTSQPSVLTWLEDAQREYKAYDNQVRKFKKILVDISKNKEKFFPEESKGLFKEYVEIVSILRDNVKSIIKNAKK